tara:strand:- start:827 stop:2395 length:1569 start_codon:yes stop_codon:yes gene_type:complete
MKKIIILGVLLWLLLNWFASSVGLNTAKAELNDTATTGNLLPNNNTTSSNKDNFDLDGVQSGSTGALNNNSTHNGFSITCNVQVNNSCGSAFNGELEGSADMTVSYSGSLNGVSGVDESGNSHTTNQKKLDGGLALVNNFSVQNCEHSGSSFKCGQSDGAVDSYTLSMKIKDNDGNILSETTITRVDDSGYYGNSLKHTDSLSYHGTGANAFDWSWSTVDGSGLNNGTKASNLLGAELNLEFATEEYEPFTPNQIQGINNALGTNNLNESELWNVISRIEHEIENKIVEKGIKEKFEVVIEENLQIKIVTQSKAPKIKELIQELQKKEIVNVIKEEVIIAIEKEKKPEVMAKEIIEEVIKEEKIEKEKTVKVIEEKKEETKTAGKEALQEKKTKTTKSEDRKSEKTKIAKKEIKSKLEKKLDKVDLKVKDNFKNIEVKNIIISDELINNSISLAVYENKEFYKSKDIYLNQLSFIDNRKIYENLNLANYTSNDPIFKKEQLLNDINIKQQKILIEIEALTNG